MNRFHEIIGKKMWFVLFNVAAIGWLIVSGRLEWTLESVFVDIIVLLIFNFIAFISAKQYPDWK
jgi:hypothetical protein